MLERRYQEAFLPVENLISLSKTYLRALLHTPVYWWRAITFKRASWYWFGQNKTFRNVIVHYLWRYLFVSPFTICRQYFRKNSDDSVQTTYGETPLLTFKTMADLANIKQGECVYELGCGRGIGVFWLRLFKRCHCLGIDINPIFIRKAREVQRATQTDKIDFLRANFLECDMTEADVIYLYGSALSDSAICKLAQHFELLRAGTRIVTVSYPLCEYTKSSHFPIQDVVEGSFLWGNTALYLQTRI